MFKTRKVKFIKKLKIKANHKKSKR